MKYSFLCLLALSCLLAGCTPKKDHPFSQTGFAFDTVIQVTVYEGGDEDTFEGCMALADSYERLLSPYVENSDIWNINHSNGSPVTVDADTLEVLERALYYAQISDGLVDPTVGSLSMLWNFGSGNQEILPESAAIEEALSHVDYHMVHIDGNQVSLADPEACMDLGFIAKGFIGDKMKEYLVSEGVTSALINLGGNVVTLGSKPGNVPFVIGIQAPFKPTGTSALTMELSDSSLVSSGNYQRYFEKDGVLYHHILSTATGYPAESGLSQVSILSENSMDCDALSTLCFVLGYEKAAALLADYPDIQAVFITTEGDLLYANFPAAD